MKILQLIDTMHAGGAEKLALNYANALSEYKIDSHICITREKGILLDKIHDNVHVHFLNKKSVFDFQALIKLMKILKTNRIDIIHAHGSSWYFALLCKFFGLKIKVIWHDHFGNSEYLDRRKFYLLKHSSYKIDGIISVNKKLKDWAITNLYCNKVIFLNNFIDIEENILKVKPKLKGNSEINLICVANLRPQKDHRTLIKAFKLISKNYNVSLHLIGKEFKNPYSRKLIALFENTPSVYWYGEKKNISPWVNLADIGILSSISEGLPLALLEYANAGLGVVCTDVGECREVIGKYGRLIEPGNSEDLARKISIYIKDPEILREESGSLKQRIDQYYSKEYVIPKYISFCTNL